MSSAEPDLDLQRPQGVPLLARRGMRPLAWLTLQLLLLLLGVMSLGWNLLALPLLVLPAAHGRVLGRRVIAGAYAWYWRVAARSGLLQMDASVLRPLAAERGLVVVANHPSLLDALMLVAQLPRAACVMKAELLRNPFLGAGARLAHYIDNRSAHGMVSQAVAELRLGGQLVLFPEGTRTTEHPVNAFGAAAGLIAKHARAPVQAVFIETDSPYLGKGWPLWRLPPLPIVFTVRLGRRFDPPCNPQAFRTELQAYFAAALQACPLPTRR